MKARISNLLRNLNGKLIATFEVDANPEDLQEYLDKDIDLEVKKITRKRSLDANALLWAMLGEMAATIGTDKWTLYLMMLKRYGKYTYISLKPEAVEDFRKMYRECEIVGETDDKVYMLCYIGSSTYSREEFSRLLDGVLSECREADIKIKTSAQIEELYKSWQR